MLRDSKEQKKEESNDLSKKRKKELKNEMTYQVVKSEWKSRNIVEFDPNIHCPKEMHIVTHQQRNAMIKKSQMTRVLAEIEDGKKVVKRDANNHLIMLNKIVHNDQPYIEMTMHEYQKDYAQHYSKKKKIKKAKSDDKDPTESNQKSNDSENLIHNPVPKTTEMPSISQRLNLEAKDEIRAKMTLFQPRGNTANVYQIFEMQDNLLLSLQSKQKEDETKQLKR